MYKYLKVSGTQDEKEAPEQKKLVSVEEPNLLEDIFRYDQVPRITFDGKI